MIGLRVTVPVASFRKGLAREFLETEPLPPPATVYGFLLALVGEVDRWRHERCRICPVLINRPERSVILRTLWRVKDNRLGASENARPDYQQILSPVHLVIWLDSHEEKDVLPLEQRVRNALADPTSIDRFGGLSLGESTHLVDEVNLFDNDETKSGRAFLLSPHGRLTLPVWVDHVGSKGTRYATGELTEGPLVPPALQLMPQILGEDRPP
jgi:CRISPR-associated protein Cas5t